MFRKKLHLAILLATVGHAASAFEFHLQQSFNDHAGEEERVAIEALFRIKTADFNNDGNMDIWFADYQLTPNTANEKIGKHSVWLNDGSGLLVQQEQKLNVPFITPINIVDINNDGNMDMVTSVTYLNDGQGNFSDVMNRGENGNGYDMEAAGYMGC